MKKSSSQIKKQLKFVSLFDTSILSKNFIKCGKINPFNMKAKRWTITMLNIWAILPSKQSRVSQIISDLNNLKATTLPADTILKAFYIAC